MASTVLAYASKATSKVSGGQVPEKPTEDKAKPPLSEKPSQEAAKSATAAKKEEEPPKPSGSAASAPPPKPDPPPSKPTPPPPPTKPETSSANRKRHDSQGKLLISILPDTYGYFFDLIKFRSFTLFSILESFWL